MAGNYEVNYDDERFANVETDKQNALNEVEQTYGDMIDKSDSFYQAQIDASQQWADKQSQLQQENTDFAIEQIEQQKDQAKKDYTKEQSGAYVDWQKQSNQYGANAEKMAQGGMTGTGFSESSQVSMYNTYQNRAATARETFSRTILQYDNNIKEARLQNNSILAEIAFTAQQQQLELALQGFQYKNQLVLDQMNKKIEVDQIHYQRWQDVLGQINTENALAENVRQFNESQALERQKLDESIRQFNQNYDQQIKEYNESIRQFNLEIERLRKKDAQEYELEIKNLELNKKKMEEQKRQFEAEQKLKRDQLAEEKRQFDKQYQAQQAQIKKSSSSGSSSKGTSSSSSKKSNSGAITGSVGTKNSGSATPTNNMASILALGYGPISASRLASLISSGQVKRTLKNGQYYYTKNTTSTSYNRLKNMGLSK